MEKSRRSIINYEDDMKIPTPIAQRKKEKLLPPPFGDLPFELVSGTLLRLTAEELLRCKCVCKRWCDDIETPDFIHSHTRRIINDNIYNPANASSSIIICTPKDDKYTKKPDNTLMCIDFRNPEKLKIKKLGPYYLSLFCDEFSPSLVGSCNGLLCFTQWYTHERKRKINFMGNRIIYERRFFVYNPITGEYKIMPSLRNCQILGHKYGFGYDCMSDDYKMFCLARGDETHGVTPATQAVVYSLKSNSWKLVEEPCPFQLDSVKTSRMVLSNNALHLIVESDIIYGFDLGSCKYHEIARPTDHVVSDDGSRGFIDLAHLRGCLHLVSLTEIWIMKEYGVKESWTKLFHFSQETDRVISGKTWMIPYAYSEAGTEILVLKGPSLDRFFRVDLRTQQCREVLMSPSLPKKKIYRSTIMPWVGSFVSPASFGSSTT